MVMSRFEQILQAMINGEECKLRPQSRSEVLLLALHNKIQSGTGESGGSDTKEYLTEEDADNTFNSVMDNIK